jgi:hypothetical protein
MNNGLQRKLEALHNYEEVLRSYVDYEALNKAPYAVESFLELNGITLAMIIYMLVKHEPAKAAVMLLTDPKEYAMRFINVCDLNQLILHAHRRLISTSPTFKDMWDELDRTMVEARAVVREEYEEWEGSQGSEKSPRTRE